MDYSTLTSHVCLQVPGSERLRDVDVDNQPSPDAVLSGGTVDHPVRKRCMCTCPFHSEGENRGPVIPCSDLECRPKIVRP
ncbi:hypothetical protein AG1IA_00557 [Rhizoctonia solani AG-1 IA]|uniref:Uncharacterized protein n=1 Tax=Thanatephorus cucumeris (strain AG1-IA) TaxID=983506 RepID=L8X8K3_THACA|nr:hypothetical protein AG1IA_00557 [Rhizoctonia solani AG-1 IA]